MTEPFPLIDIAGAPRERGRQYGRQAGDRIGVSLSLYQGAFARHGLAWPAVREVAARYLRKLEGFDAELSEEIRGIAEGVERPVEDIVALNARTEMLYDPHIERQRIPELEDGCTGAVVLPTASADGHMLHGQNWDWYDACKDSAVVVRIDLGGDLRLLTFVEAGIVARAGLNSHGIALTGNFLDTDAAAVENAVPIPLVRRRVLQSATLANAIQEIYRAPRSFSNNMMLSHADGEAVDLETTPGEVFWEKPEGGILVHANHFRSAGALAKVRDIGLLHTPDSLYRDSRVTAILTARRGEIRIDDLKEAFADRFGAPRAVCRSPVTGERGGTTSSVATIIMDVTERRMIVAPTPYNGTTFTEYRLDA